MALMRKEMKCFIHTKDVDWKDQITPASIFDLFQDIAGLHAGEIGVGYPYMKDHDMAWVVLYQQYEILKMPPYLEDVLLITWPKPKGKLEFEREYEMRSLEGELLVRGISNWVVIGLEKRNLIRADRVEFNGEYVLTTSFPEKQPRKLSLDDSKCSEFFTHRVNYGDLDHNGHMNNASYLKVIFDACPFKTETNYFKKVEIAYIKEAKLNDFLEIGYYRNEKNQDIYIGKIQQERCFECIVTMEG